MNSMKDFPFQIDGSIFFIYVSFFYSIMPFQPMHYTLHDVNVTAITDSQQHNRQTKKGRSLNMEIITGIDVENLSSKVCEQQRCRPACAFAQSDQHLCFLLIGKYPT